jgi:benzylsuccinate CoA-transferase BbsF subunit
LTQALAGYRICDFTGQLAGAGATKWLAAFGAEVIRIEDPTRQGRWDILRGSGPYQDERRGVDYGGAFNNHNINKQGITLNLKTERGKELLRELIAVSDVVSENFAAGVLAKLGFSYEQMQAIKPDVVYVSNCGFGHAGPYGQFKTWGPIVQAVSGLTFTSSLPNQPPAGWGYSYMDHTGGYYMAMAILAALLHRQQTGEGQWVDLSCTDAALTLNGPALLDWTVNGRGLRGEQDVNSNRSQYQKMAPHGIYPCSGTDQWIAIACRQNQDWLALAELIQDPWTNAFGAAAVRLENQDTLDSKLASWTKTKEKFALQGELRSLGIAVSVVQTPQERIDADATTAAAGLWPTVTHSKMGKVRVDGQPVHLSETDWSATHGAPCLGEHTDQVLTQLLGVAESELPALREANVI